MVIPLFLINYYCIRFLSCQLQKHTIPFLYNKVVAFCCKLLFCKYKDKDLYIPERQFDFFKNVIRILTL
jgi:hypothetical protein